MKSIKNGFTLIELLIVIAIIGVLAVAFLPSVLGAPSKGRDTQRIAQVQKLQQLFTAESVAGDAAFAETTTACISKGVSTDKSISLYVQNHIADFGGVFPEDPQPKNPTTDAVAVCTDNDYGFVMYVDPAKTYTAAVYARVENPENANITCANIDVNADPTLVTTFTEAELKTALCYIALIQ